MEEPVTPEELEGIRGLLQFREQQIQLLGEAYPAYLAPYKVLVRMKQHPGEDPIQTAERIVNEIEAKEPEETEERELAKAFVVVAAVELKGPDEIERYKVLVGHAL